MGGLIVRAALPKLIMYKERMNRFICFASPHLGNVYSKSKLVRLGMWGFRFWYKSESLNQMAYADANNVRNTAMYELSKEPGLDWFIDVTLISSTQDTYCPLESGRIQSSDQIDQDTSDFGHMIKKMIRRLQTRLKSCSKVRRININIL